MNAAKCMAFEFLFFTFVRKPDLLNESKELNTMMCKIVSNVLVSFVLHLPKTQCDAVAYKLQSKYYCFRCMHVTAVRFDFSYFSARIIAFGCTWRSIRFELLFFGCWCIRSLTRSRCLRTEPVSSRSFLCHSNFGLVIAARHRCHSYIVCHIHHLVV